MNTSTLRENAMPFRHLLAMCALFATVDATAYAFQPNQGLQLREHLGAVYTIGNTSGALAAGKDTRLTFSRGADALVNIYQDGKLVMSKKDTQPYTNAAC